MQSFASPVAAEGAVDAGFEIFFTLAQSFALAERADYLARNALFALGDADDCCRVERTAFKGN